MNEAPGITLAQLQAVCAASPFSAWAGFVVVAARDGFAELEVGARPDLMQHSGFLHAGVAAGLIDTAAGFAAATLAGAVLTSSFQTAFYRPACGEMFIARAQVARAGKRQIFVNVDLFARDGDSEKLVAGGTAVLMTVAEVLAKTTRA